jgi:hypothetical protein
MTRSLLLFTSSPPDPTSVLSEIFSLNFTEFYVKKGPDATSPILIFVCLSFSSRLWRRVGPMATGYLYYLELEDL